MTFPFVTLSLAVHVNVVLVNIQSELGSYAVLQSAFLREREGGRERQNQNRWKEYRWVLVVHWARPGLKLHPCLNIISGCRLPPQPEWREERRTIDSRHTPSTTSHPSLLLCLSVLPQRSKSDVPHAIHYIVDHWNSNMHTYKTVTSSVTGWIGKAKCVS